MHQRDQQRNRPPLRLGAGARRSAANATFALASIVGLAIAGAAGCGDDDDNTNVGNGGSAGAAGRGGSGGTAGRGGSGGTAGTGAGSGGSAGTGGAAGTAGTGGTGGTAGSGGTSGDAGAPLSEQEIAAAICVTFEAVPECPPLDKCVDAQLAALAGFKSVLPGCPELVDTYFACLAVAPVSGFECSSADEPGPLEATCANEQAAMNGGFANEVCTTPPPVPDAGPDGG